METELYPFSAIVGQENMKRALILNLINPSLGGVLIRGEKGTAKSTAVRALVDILPEIEVVKDCIYNCRKGDDENHCEDCRNKETLEFEKSHMKIINLPISSTEDRVVGTLDIEEIIKKGEKKFEPGILAGANGNILYIDEVNLLEDHIVDLLLDAAAMGVNIIEREGVSHIHPAKFVLIGTMNPEEGDLRPQLIDRFGLVVDIAGEKEIENRVEIMKRRLAFEKNPKGFRERYSNEGVVLIKNIENAKEKLNRMTVDKGLFGLIAGITNYVGVDGHRADLAIIRTAMANAAFLGRNYIEKEDIYEGVKLALPHRMRRLPFEENILDLDYIKKIIKESKLIND